MAKAKFWQNGGHLDYLNNTGADIEANTVITLGSRIGVAGANIPNGETGALIVEGVFELNKTDSTKIDAGTVVYWDGNGITATSGEDTVPAGYTTNDAAADAGAVLVKINA